MKKTRNYTFRKDIKGKKYGKLTVDYYVGHGIWHCICDCGNEVDVDTRNLNSGHTRSCGCLVKEINSQNNSYDMTGYENNHLIVMSREGSNQSGQALWKCKCKHCGNTFIESSGQIVTGRSRCTKCRKKGESMDELYISKLLDENNIKYKRQYTFADLRGKNNKRYKYDFAVFDDDGKLSHLIEYNDYHHYTHSDKPESETVKESRYRDNRKIQYCKDNNIELKIITGSNYTINDLI